MKCSLSLEDWTLRAVHADPQEAEKPVLVEGVNWIQDDVLPGRMTRDRYAIRRPYAVTWLDRVLLAATPDPSGGR